jgi:malonyl CoA-acyl carrier protein transacylase
VFEEADKALGLSISKMCFEGSEEELKQTANTQPAILTCSVAVFRVAAEKGLSPDFVAGHSLGEYSALVAAGCLKFSDAVQLVRKRGRTCRRQFLRAKARWPRFWDCRRRWWRTPASAPLKMKSVRRPI